MTMNNSHGYIPKRIRLRKHMLRKTERKLKVIGRYGLQQTINSPKEEPRRGKSDVKNRLFLNKVTCPNLSQTY